MPTWAWVLSILLALLGLAALFLSLLRFRYHLEWRGEWGGPGSSSEGVVRLEYGVPGFMREWDPGRKWSLADLLIEDEHDEDFAEKQAEKQAEETMKSAAEPSVVEEAPAEDSEDLSEDLKEKYRGGRKSEPDPASMSPGFSRRALRAKATGTSEEPFFLHEAKSARPEARNQGKNHKTASRQNRIRRALFRFATDPDVWKFSTRYGMRALRSVLRLLHPRFEAAVGHPDPAFLGRAAGKWYTVRPLLPLGDSTLHFRFQDRHPSLWVQVRGGFSALSVAGFALRLILTFPLLRLGYRAFYGWRNHKLTGWRAGIYRKLQTLR